MCLLYMYIILVYYILSESINEIEISVCNKYSKYLFVIFLQHIVMFVSFSHLFFYCFFKFNVSRRY